MTSPELPQIPTSTREMLQRTRRRADQIRRRRRAVLGALGAAVVVAAVAVPLALTNANHHDRLVGVTGEPTTITAAPTTAVTTAPSTVPLPSLPPTTPPVASRSTSTIPSATTTTTRPKAVAQCATSQLRASLANPSGAAGSVGYELTLVNSSAQTCSVGGYPGVSYVTARDGTIVGAPASRDPLDPVVTVTLAPGKAATALLIEVDSLNYPPNTCQLTNVGGVRIYPPNQTAALFVPQSTHACGNPADPVLQVGPFQP